MRGLAEGLEPLVQPVRVQVGSAEAEIHLRPLLACLHHPLELLDRFGRLVQIEEDEAHVVVRLTRGGVDFQRLLQHLERAARVLQLPFDFAEQGQELCIAWRGGERGLELFPRALVAAEIEVDVGEIVARRHERRD